MFTPFMQKKLSRSDIFFSLLGNLPFVYPDFMCYFTGTAFHIPTAAEKMYYLALVGDKWSEVEPPFLGSIAENLWGRIFPGSRVFWWLLAVYHLKKRARKYSKTPAFSFYQRLHIEINLLKRKSLMFQMKGYFWKKYYCYQLH